MQYGIDIASGLQAMHDVNVMHRDLHSDNILVTADRAVVADLGSAKKVIPGVR
jgi:serine/threonine protein kinase